MRFIALALVCTGCTTWRIVGDYDRVVPGVDDRLVLRGDALPGSVALSSGILVFSLDVDHACRHTALPQREHVVRRVHELTSLGRAAMVVGSGFLAAAHFIGPNPAGVAFAVAALALEVGPPLALSGPRRDVAVESHPEPPAFVACRFDGDDLGLELTTPWGARVDAPVELDGEADFAVDWASAPLDPQELGGAYTIRSRRGGTRLVWTPSSDEAALMGFLAEAAHSREGA